MSIIINYVQELKPYQLLIVPSEKVPSQFINGLKTKYPDAEPEEWVRNSKGLYGAFFMNKVWPKFALLDENGNWVETFVYSLKNTITPEVAKGIRKYHRKYTIDRVLTMINAIQSRTYHIFLETNDGNFILHMSESGELLSRAAYIHSELHQELKGIMVNDDDDEDDDDDEFEAVKLSKKDLAEVEED